MKEEEPVKNSYNTVTFYTTAQDKINIEKLRKFYGFKNSSYLIRRLVKEEVERFRKEIECKDD